MTKKFNREKALQNYTKWLEHGFAFMGSETRFAYLADHIFNFTTFDAAADKQFATKAVETCFAILSRMTIEYINTGSNYQWYLIMCNMPFFIERIDYDDSIREAYWNREIEFESCGLYVGNVQMPCEQKFSRDEWECFICAVIEFARPEMPADTLENLEQEDKNGRSPLAQAAACGNIKRCLALIANGADIESMDDSGKSPLQTAAQDGNTETCLALLDRGADLEAKDDEEHSPLSLAAAYGQIETCLALLDCGADLESKNQRGESPLDMAAANGKTETCIALLDRGANLESKDDDGNSPLSAAGFHGKTATSIELMSRGASTESKNCDGLTPAQVAEARGNHETASAIRSWAARQMSNRLLKDFE